MNPAPTAIGLTLCEKVIVEEGTQSTTFVSTFVELLADEFPFRPERFALAAVLTGGQGDGVVELAIAQLETLEEAYSLRQPLHFPDRPAELPVAFHIRDCSFPAPGPYEAVLLVDGDRVARRTVSVVQQEEQS
jgi:hypothetical protein